MHSMVTLWPATRFQHPILVYHPPSEGIKILGVPLGTFIFTSSFIKDAMLENVQHMDLLPIMGDVQITFGILTHCFVQQPSSFLQCTPPSSTFIETFISFDSSFFKIFRHFLGFKSFDSPKGLLTCKQFFLQITFGGISFIPTSTITFCPNNLFRKLGLCSFDHSY